MDRIDRWCIFLYIIVGTFACMTILYTIYINSGIITDSETSYTLQCINDTILTMEG